MASCNSSLDCPLTEAGVAQFCYESAIFSEERNFCDCFNWFGFIGENCNEPTSTAKYFKVIGSIIIIWSFILVFLTTRTFVLGILLRVNPEKGVDPVFYGGFFILLGSFFLFLSYSLQIIPFLEPTYFQVSETNSMYNGFNSDDTITPPLDITDSCFLILSVACFFLSAILFISSWQKVIEGTLKYRTNSKISFKREKRTRPRLFYLSIGVILSLTILMCFKLIVESSVIATLLCISFTIGFIIFAYKFIKIINSMEVQTNLQVKNIIRLVKGFVILVTISLIWTTIFLILFYTSTLGFVENSELNAFNYALLFRDLSVIGALIFATASSWYFNSVSEGIVLTDEWKICRIFSLWDKMNFSLMPETPTTNDLILTKQQSEPPTLTETLNTQDEVLLRATPSATIYPLPESI